MRHTNLKSATFSNLNDMVSLYLCVIKFTIIIIYTQYANGDDICITTRPRVERYFYMPTLAQISGHRHCCCSVLYIVIKTTFVIWR